MNVLLVAGARPNFMKIAPLYRESRRYPDVRCRIVHTGQHYDYVMSQAFFEDLELPAPDFFLEAGSGSHAHQTAKIMVAFEEVCEREHPDLVVVVGDVNSTLACGIVAKKLWILLAHVEAGLRSFDRRMPEEINRLVTDAVSDLFFVTEERAVENLVREGKLEEQVHQVGNVMIDNLHHQLERLNRDDQTRFPSFELKKRLGDYAFLTLHRPSNVDSREVFQGIVKAVDRISEEMDILFPVHPRTRETMSRFDVRFSDRVHLLPPLGFRESLFLWKDARVVLTDSGGLQEETTALSIPCVTIRENTERPITVEVGSNVLAGTETGKILDAYGQSLKRAESGSAVPPLWDGRAAERIWRVLVGAGG